MYLTIKQIPICLSVCLSSYILRTVHLTYFTLGRFVADDRRKCSVGFGAVWTRTNLLVLRVQKKTKAES